MESNEVSPSASVALSAARSSSLSEPSASSSSHIPLNGSTATQDNGLRRQKRARSQLSCTPCRLGKLKCNRLHDPACDQCIKRNRESSCVYVPPPVKHKPTQNVKGRIKQLENLVVDLMNQNRVAQSTTQPVSKQSKDDFNRPREATRSTTMYSQPTPPSDNDHSPRNKEVTPPADIVDGATKPFGQMRISKNQTSYVGDTHWNSILDSISELKRDLDDDEPDDDLDVTDDESPEDPESWASELPGGGTFRGGVPIASQGANFMFESRASVTKEQLIQSLPEKKVIDRLLSLWFNSPDPFKPVIHAPTFQEEYRAFWRNKAQTPTMWLGLLYSILSLAASFGLREVDPDSDQGRRVLKEVERYHSLAASAATLADYTKSRRYTLECLILYSAGLRSNNAFVNVWLLIGLALRLALRMGYHRDSSHYPAISSFDGEMRRRVWAIISMIDVLVSFQLGLPSMVKTIQWDTEAPRNLLDRDFSRSTKVLPPSRSVDDLTPSSYTRAKLRLVRVFAAVAESSHSTVPPTYDEMMRLDRDLEDARAAVPPLLQMPEISELVTDPAEQMMCRFNLDLLYLKTKLVLHRRYMLQPLEQLTPEEQKRGIGNSRILCTESALRVMKHHQTIYAACQPGGQLESVKWYMGSISTHDFLLAAMIICLELSEQINDPLFAEKLASGITCPKRGAMMEALEKSQQIWSSASGVRQPMQQFHSKDAMEKGGHMYSDMEKASRAMSVMLEKVNQKFAPHNGRTASTVTSPDASGSDKCGYYRSPQPQSVTNRQPFKIDQGRNFTGILATFDWNGLDGVENMQNVNSGGLQPTGLNNATLFDNTNILPVGEYSATMNNIGQPADPFYGADDFAMIGDMLDVPVSLNWEMWDSEIIQQRGLNNDNTMNGAGMTGTIMGHRDPPAQSSMTELGSIHFGDPMMDTSGAVMPPTSAVENGNVRDDPLFSSSIFASGGFGMPDMEMR